MNFANLIAEHIQKLVPYMSARRIGGHGHTFLNANEAPKSETYIFNSTNLNRYPDCQPEELISAYADYCDLLPSEVLAARGSDEIIGLIMRTFIEQKREGVLIAPPTYGMYEVAANTNNVQVAYAKRNGDFSLTAYHFIEALKYVPFKVKAIFIDSPANPLGLTFPKDELITLLNELPDTLIVIDEAYVEYTDPAYDFTKLIREYENLIVTRTLSKAFALAGLRCGFALANPQIIKAMLKVIDPYPVPDPCVQIAKQALAKGGIELMQARVKETLERRATFEKALQELPMVDKIFKSEANFLLIKFKDGKAVFDALSQKGIILRSFEDKPGLRNCIRITIGSAEEMDEVMRTLTEMGEAS
ncbi:MAG: histidinol-phosphate transaminase [Succinivibrio sp.]|nr:histidinol-phosphate transaminase [Succinivibrio sp.]